MLAVVVASLGLFGLAGVSATRRMKEISIRKVLGATMPQVLRTLNTEFLWLIMIANTLAWPAAYSIQSLVTANPNIAIGRPSPTRADAIAPIASVVPVATMMMAVVTTMMMAVVITVTMTMTAVTMTMTAVTMTMTAMTTMTMTAMTTMTMTMTAMTTMTMTAMTAVTMTGERRHGKQHGSRYRANKRELPKHEFLRGSARDPLS
jgi:ABC-type antimicrobial peptide transport system permease subunit